MSEFQLILLLIAICFSQSSQSKYFVSPSLPPTSYYGEYYTVHFRVIGMDNPTFSFENVPDCFKAYNNGSIQGTPDKIGSFSIKITFSSGEETDSRETVLRTVSSRNDKNEGNPQFDTGIKYQMEVSSQISQFVFTEGSSISFCLTAINAKEPIVWNFVNLPSKLIGNTNGCISGTIQQTGYYSYLVSLSDRQGSTVDSYFTLNIQPKSVLKDSSLLDIPTVALTKYDLQQVEDEAITATKNLFVCLRQLYKAQDQMNECTIQFNKTTSALNIANSLFTKQEDEFKNKSLTRNQANQRLQKATVGLRNSLNTVSLANLSYQSTKNTTDSISNQIEQLQQDANLQKNIYYSAINFFINAQTESSQASATVKLQVSTDINARNDYNTAFSTLSNRKQDLQQAQDEHSKANSIVTNYTNILSIVRKLNDDALSKLAQTQKKLESAEFTLKMVNKEAQLLQSDLEEAADQLGTAKFKLQQAINVLFVAQARKEQADKATELVRLQTSSQASSFLFAGCQQYAYPTISGSATILKDIANGFQLSSGHQLIYGNCTQTDKRLSIGDIIQYQGYIKNGIIHSLKCLKY